MSRKHLVITLASLLLVLGVLLAPGLFSSTAQANSKASAIALASGSCPVLKLHSGYNSSSERQYVKLLQNKLKSFFSQSGSTELISTGKVDVNTAGTADAHTNGKVDANIEADGYFGSNTEQTVKDFQKAKKLGVDGIVGDKTWNALGKCANLLA